MRVADVMRPLDDALQVAPETSLADAMRRMASAGAGRLVVMRDGRLEGLLTKTGVARFVELQTALRAE